MPHRRTRPAVVAVAGALITLAACSSGADTNAHPDGAPESDVRRDGVAGSASDAAAVDTTDTVTTGDDERPTAQPVTTTTTVPPIPTAQVTTVVLDDGAALQLVHTLGDAVSSTDFETMFVAGSSRVPGEGAQATLHVGNGIDPFVEVELSAADAPSTVASSIATADATVVVGGTSMAADGTTSAVVWISGDRAATFTAAQTAIDGPSRTSDVIIDGDQFVVAGTRGGGVEQQLVVASSADGTNWTSQTVAVPGTRPAVGGIVRFGDRLVLTATSRIDGATIATVLTAPDAQGAFTQHDDAEITASDDVATPAVVDGRLVVMVSRPAGREIAILESTDGAAWTQYEFNRLYDPELYADTTLIDSAIGPIVPGASGFAFGTTEQLGLLGVTLPERDLVLAQYAPYATDDTYRRPIPVSVRGRLFAVASNTAGTTWRAAAATIGEQREARSSIGPEGSTNGPGPSSVDLAVVDDEVLIRTGIYPRVTETESGGVQWGDEGRWHRNSGPSSVETLAGDAIPDDSDVLVSDGERELAFSFTPDPLDDDQPGPIGGTTLWTRSPDQAWTVAEELFLSGPGGEYVYGAAATSDGFLAVGARRQRFYGVSESEPVLMREVAGTWTDEPIDASFTYNAWLTDVTATPDGIELALGAEELSDGTRVSLVLTRSQDGVWRRAELGGLPDDASVFAVVARPGRIDLFVFDDETYFRSTTTDGQSFDAVELDFGTHAISLTGAVQLDDALYAVGVEFASGSSQLAVWEISEAVPPVALGRADPASIEIQTVDSVDGALVISAIDRAQSVLYAVTPT